jgi:hypothetical protein
VFGKAGFIIGMNTSEDIESVTQIIKGFWLQLDALMETTES